MIPSRRSGAGGARARAALRSLVLVLSSVTSIGPVAAAPETSTDLERCLDDRHAIRPLVRALAAAPRDAGSLACLALTVDEPVWQLTFLELALERAQSLAATARADLAARTLARLIELGQVQDILQLGHEQPPELLELAQAGTGRGERLGDGSSPVSALDLEAARRLAGRRGPESLASPPPGAWSWRLAGSDEPPAAAELQSELLGRLRDRSRQDPFDLLAAVLLRRESPHDREGPLSTCLWALAAAEVARAAGLGEAIESLSAPCHERLDWAEAGWAGADDLLPPTFQGRLWHRLGRVRAVASLRLGPRVARRAPAGFEPEGLARGPWRLAPIATLPPAPGPAPERCAGPKESPVEAWSRPRHLDLLRCERRGAEYLAVAHSSRLDPEAGSYWLMRSRDGGASWNGLYSGIRSQDPFVVEKSARLPMQRGPFVSLPVGIGRADELVGRLAGADLREPTALLAAWAELERDADADGLTDLAEAALLSDPADPDSDGDGLFDGVDPLPGIPFDPRGVTDAAPLAALLNEIASELQDPRPWIPGEAPSRLEDRTGAPLPLLEAPLAILALESERWRGLRPAARLVVLSREGERRLERTRPGFVPIRIAPLIFDRAGRRGFAIWSKWHLGGTVYLEATDRGWTARTIRAWIA